MIDDFVTGDQVCTSCALVLQTIIPYSAFDANEEFPDPSSSQLSSSMRTEGKTNSSTVKLYNREMIRDMCTILHVDNVFVVDTALHILESMKKPVSLTRVSDRPKLAFAIWESLNRQNTPRSPRDIANACHVSPSSMLQVEKDFLERSTFCLPHEYVETVCDFLEVPFNITLLVKEFLFIIEDRFYGRNPETLIAVALITILTKLREDDFYHERIQALTDACIYKALTLRRKTMNAIKTLIPPISIEIRKNDGQNTLHLSVHENGSM